MTVGVTLTAMTTVIEMAARGPLSSSTPVNADSARTPTTAVFMLLVGFGAVAVGALIVVLWPERRRRSDEEPVAEPPQLHWAWKVAAVLCPFGLGAALVAAVLVGLGGSRHARRLGATGLAHSLAGLTAGARGGSQSFELPSWLPWAVLGILFTTVIAVAALLRRRAQSAKHQGRSGSATRAAVQAAIGMLDSTSDPRAAVIAAYAAMGHALAAHGVGRSPAEAPREYLRRVLSTSRATEREARTLTGLFEEARFSLHPISERLRQDALSALSSLRARLDRDRPQ
jgi:hypothetical protein